MKILITGAAGFIGNVAWGYFWQQGHDLFGIDNLSRPTSKRPQELQSCEFYQADILDIDSLPLPDVDVVIHLAAQVSVTRSQTSPWADFETNAIGGVKVIEWAKRHGNPIFIYASTNKIYGEAPNSITDDNDLPRPSTPYGVSKWIPAAYLIESYKGPYRIFHQSCIYGETQMGTEDQGWIGYLLNQVKKQISITCFGTGNQVRDLLHVWDLMHLYNMAITSNKFISGAWPVGGGPGNAFTFAEVVSMMGGKIEKYAPKRMKDQDNFVAESEYLRDIIGWSPKTSFDYWLNQTQLIDEFREKELCPKLDP